ncbi:MAG: TonB-dependent receptor [Candidatus Omnitrophica bacterium]|nr:TonB-dependent receptor [Candidatus Omnitrophota bacterium]
MKHAIFISCVLSFCLSANLTFAQKINSESVATGPFPQGEKTVVSAPSSTQTPAVLPKEDEKPLVGAQESKVKVIDQKTADEIKKRNESAAAPFYPDQGGYNNYLQVDPLIVTATRSAQPMSHVGLPMTVITREQIEREGDMQVIDVLRNVPGVNVVRNGSRGRTTSVFIRGANGNHTLFMINGVEVSSPATGAYDPTNLNVEDVERIEIIRGPQSTLYGSEAIGGVINVITREGKPNTRPHVEGQFEYGTQRTFDENGAVSGGFGPVTYFGSFSRIDTGAGVASRRLEHDNYQDTNATGRFTVKLPMNSKIDTNYKFTRGYTPIDDGSFLNDTNAWTKTRDNLISSALTMNPFSWFTQTVKMSEFDSRMVSVDPPDNLFDWDSVFKLDSKIYTLDLQTNIRPFETNTITYGYEYQVQKADNRYFDQILRNNGFYLQDEQAFFNRLFLTGGARIENNFQFGKALNPKISASFLIHETGTKLKASYGTGFRAPALNELYFPFYGNPALRPETSRTYDWGFEQQLPIWNAQLGMDMYHSSFKNLIQAVPGGVFGFQAGNTGKAFTDGIELSLSCEPIKDFMQLHGNYTFLHTEDKGTDGGPLIRRPKQSGGVDVNFHLFKKWNVNLEGLFVGNRQDKSFDFTRPPRETNFGYGILNAMLSYDISKYLQIYGRAENLTDTSYSEAIGYQGSGSLFFGGVKAKV